MDTRLLCPWDCLGKSSGVGCHFLLQGFFLTQGSNLGLLHCRQTLYRLSHQGSVQLLSHVQFFATPWTAACQASLSFTISQCLLKLMSIESVMPSNHLILCHSLLFLLSIFPVSGSSTTIQLFTSGGQTIAASASILPMNIQG